MKALGKLGMTLGAVAFAGIMSTAAAAAEYNWKFQSSAQAGDNFYPMQQDWAEKVKIASGGRIEIEVLPVGSVVPHNETLDAVGANILQGQITDPSYFSGKDAAFGMLGNLVGAYSDPIQMFRFMEYGGGNELFNELMNPYGVHFIGATTPGVEAFLSSVPIRTVEDLKGVKMRAPEGMVQEIFALAGASPVPLPASEVFTSLEKGVIDAADYTAFSTNHSQGMHKFAMYPIYPGFHSMPVNDVSLNKEIWDGLPDDLKMILRLSIRELSFDMTSRVSAQDAEAVVEANADPNIEVISWSPEERKKFTTIAQNEWKNWASRSPMAQKTFDTVTTYLRSQGLME